MFKWFGSKENRAPFAGPFSVSIIPNLLAKYFDLLEKHPTEIVDASWLPATKLIMVQAFKSAWLSTQDLKLRNHIEVGWVSLSSFQDGVGSTPIGCDISGLGMKDTSKLLDRYVEWSKLSSAETNMLIMDLTAFKAANPD